MRALCGAIITAGALIGLGLSVVGFGLRYSQFQGMSTSGPVQLHLWKTDTPLAFAVVFLTIVACVGLAIAFVGLAYHHHRLHHEMLRMQNLPVSGHQVMP
jgi:hypothetical protein